MKKYLLFTATVFISGLLFAQSTYRTTKIPSHLANIAVKKSAIVEDKMYQGIPFQTYAQVTKNGQPIAVSVYSETVVGSTLYDLQSNSSPANRIVVNADGTIATCWTFEPSDASGSYANRGTGYNYYDGSSWATSPTGRIENVRVGWGNIVNTRAGGELVLSHAGGLSQLNIASRSVKGIGTWTNSTTALPVVPGGNWWPRMVTSNPAGGDTVYVLSVSYPVVNGVGAYNGLDGALLFSRSTDAGLTWDIVNQQPTGFTSANYLGFNGDAYAITAYGSTVAIVAGDSDSDIGLAKSTDGGVTWTFSTVLKFPLPLWDYKTTISDVDGDAIADTIDTNDGNFDVALDWNGTAYVAYGAFRLLNDAPSSAGYSYFPYTDGLLLWNENMPQNVGGNYVASIEDLGEQGTIYFPTPSVSGDLAFGQWGGSLTSFPTMAFDINNDLYLSYSSIVDSLISATNPEKLVRHQYLTKSTSLVPFGEVFCPPHDLVPASPGAEYEGVLGSMAKNINGYVHILYMRDYYPGNGVPPSSGTNPDADNLGNPNDMVYVKIPPSDFLPCYSGIKENSKSISSSILNFYPNPASTSATIEVALTETAKLDIAILNTVGQTIYSTSVNGTIGSNKVDVNLNNLSAGLYFYQVKIAGSKAITQKFAVEK